MMKTVLTWLLIGVMCSPSFSGTEVRKEMWISIPIQIIQTGVDSQLTQNEALFELSFTASGLAIEQKEKINFSCNGVIHTLKINANGNILVKVIPGKYIFNFFYNDEHYEITTDSVLIQAGFRTVAKVNFRNSKIRIKTKKPIIYLYPKKRTKVTVLIDVDGEMEFSYPAYNQGWTFIANPDGTLEFGLDRHNYLFWDGTAGFGLENLHMEEGFIVSRQNVVEFLEDKLSQMGFNSNETEDFITYWAPLMIKHQDMYVHFMFNADYDSIATIDISPKPDNLFRVSMLWSDWTEGQAIPKEQKIQKFNRKGFSVIEWGGSYTPGLVDMISHLNQLNPTQSAFNNSNL